MLQNVLLFSRELRITEGVDYTNLGVSFTLPLLNDVTIFENELSVTNRVTVFT